MDTSSTAPRTVILHDGELGDVRVLLEDLGAEVVEHGADSRIEPATLDAATLVVATARRALDAPAPSGEPGERATWIVIQDWDSLSLPEPEHADFLLRRPFHPSTLRLLVQRALYRGPERRRSQRVGIGARVRFRAGLWRRSATLVELSISGCRLVSKHKVRTGQAVQVFLPGELVGGAELVVAGRAVRFGREAGPADESEVLGVEFEPLPVETWERLSALIARHVRGSPPLPGAKPQAAPASSARAAEPSVAATPSEPPPRGRAVAEVPKPAAPAASPTPRAASSPEADAHRRSCRRRAPRRAYSRRVIALGDRSARVLIARDLSAGGMRAEPNPDFSVGDELRLALHVRPGQEPLVVQARVDRDDGERGLVLRFDHVSSAAADYLRRMLEDLPVLDDPSGGAGGRSRRIVAEVVDSPPA